MEIYQLVYKWKTNRLFFFIDISARITATNNSLCRNKYINTKCVNVSARGHQNNAFRRSFISYKTLSESVLLHIPLNAATARVAAIQWCFVVGISFFSLFFLSPSFTAIQPFSIYFCMCNVYAAFYCLLCEQLMEFLVTMVTIHRHKQCTITYGGCKCCGTTNSSPCRAHTHTHTHILFLSFFVFDNMCSILSFC